MILTVEEGRGVVQTSDVLVLQSFEFVAVIACKRPGVRAPHESSLDHCFAEDYGTGATLMRDTMSSVAVKSFLIPAPR
jgi:hypothetical protein